MRVAARLGGVLLLVAAMSACDKAQVAVLESQTVELTFTASSTLVPLYNVWDLIEDNDLNQIPDDGVTYLFCRPVPPGMGGAPITLGVNSAPWRHSLRISILRADGTEFEQITGDAYLDPTANLTQYDTRVLFNNVANQPSVLQINDGGTMRRFLFSDPRQMTAVNRAVVSAITNPLYEIDSVTYGYRSGLCSVSDPGPATTAGLPQPFTVQLAKGETIKIEARKALAFTPGIVDNMSVSLLSGQPVLTGHLALDGVDVVNLSGDSSSSTATADGISFFFTSR